MVLLESFWLTETVLQEAITKTLEAKARQVASLDVLKLLCIKMAIINDLDNKTVMLYLFTEVTQRPKQTLYYHHE